MSEKNNSLEIQERSLALEVSRFELEQRRSSALSKSAFFPVDLRGDIASAVIVYDLAQRMNISVMEVSQSVYIIYGRPSFSTTFMVARLNQSGLIRGTLKVIVSQDKQSAYCEAIDAETGETITGMTVTMKMAQAEGWVSKKGSKWQTMPELMLRKRCQSFFIKEFYPQVMFGLQSSEEIEDAIEVKAIPSAGTQDLNAALMKKPAPRPEPEPDAMDAEVEEVADQVHKEMDETMGHNKAKEAPEPPKRTRRTKAEVEELLEEINKFRPADAQEYTKLGEVPEREGREAVARIEARKVNDIQPDEETTEEMAQRHQDNADMVVEKAKAREDEDDDIPWANNQTSSHQDFGRVDIKNGITQKISERFDFLVEHGMKPEDFQQFVFYANLDDDNIQFVEEDVAWIEGVIKGWNTKTGQE